MPENLLLLLISVILLILSVRKKLGALGEDIADHPHVPEDGFEKWRSREVTIGNIGIWGNFLYFVLELGNQLVLKTAYPGVAWPMGIALFFAWGMAILVGLLKGFANAQLRRDLGIVWAARRKA